MGVGTHMHNEKGEREARGRAGKGFVGWSLR